MFKSGSILSSDAHFTAAQHNKTYVPAWQDGAALHHGALIESFTSDAVKTDDGKYFMRLTCTFKVR